MSSKVIGNYRSIVHSGDGLLNISAVPDVCKTPSPGGPVPVPYPNFARDADLADGAKHVTIAGHPVALEKSNISRSSGDEAGTLGGIISGKNMGKMTWGTSSPNIILEGQGVIRFGDLTQHNCNTFNVVHVQGGTPLVYVLYGDDAECPICEKVHAGMPSKSESPPDPAALVEELAGALGALPGKGLRASPDGSGQPSGYMIGVLITRCGQAGKGADVGKAYAACSGFPNTSPHDEFISAARSKGFVPCVKRGIDGLREAMRPNAERLIRKGRKTNLDSKTPEQKGRLIDERVTRELKVAASRQGNSPGKCAAQRLIAQALQDKHTPVMLCEKWYAPAGAPNPDMASYEHMRREWLATGDAAMLMSDSAPSKASFSHGQTAPSCTTCGKLVPFLMCGVEEC